MCQANCKYETVGGDCSINYLSYEELPCNNSDMENTINERRNNPLCQFNIYQAIEADHERRNQRNNQQLPAIHPRNT